MVRIASYTLVDRIHDGAETCIYRAVRDADRLPVILKTPNVPYPSRRQLARLQHEYAMLKKAGGRGAVLPIELIQTADVVALVTEDWGGQTLHSLIAAGALGWREAATIGLHIADALAALHDQGILHKDLWFSNNLENQAGWSGRGNGEEGCRATDYRAQRTARQGGPLRLAGGAGRREQEGGSGKEGAAPRSRRPGSAAQPRMGGGGFSSSRSWTSVLSSGESPPAGGSAGTSSVLLAKERR